MTTGTAYHLKITLKHTNPLVWRFVVVDSQVTLEDLHYIIQFTMGWTGSHLHLFQSSKKQRFGCIEDDEDGILELEDERTVKLIQLLYLEKQALHYEYDFGDGWEHEVRLVRIEQNADISSLPKCLEAHGQCPPEDVGGVGGFEEFKAVMADPTHDEYENFVAWNDGPFDPLAVDLSAINDDLAHIEEILAEGEEQELLDFGMPDFQGLSPQEIHPLLYNTFECPEVVLWADEAPATTGSPLMRMLSVLFAELHEKDITLTKKGNLPSPMVKVMLAAADGCDLEMYHWQLMRSVRGEDDATPVHYARIVAEVTGLLRVAKGKLNITVKARKLLKSKGLPSVYRLLLESLFKEFNWAYIDGHSPIMGLRVTAPFTLWLLHRYGHDWANDQFYAQLHVSAFPQLLHEAESGYFSPEDDFRNTYCHRMGTVLQLLGLIDVQAIKDTNSGIGGRILQWRASPLLREVIQWQV